MWRRPVVRSAALVSLAMLVLSLGPELWIGRRDTGIPLPWALLKQLPPLGTVVELRFAGACLPLFAVIVAMAADAAIRTSHRDFRLAGVAGLCVALIPLIPVPLQALTRPETPRFITQKMWTRYVDHGSIVFAPLPDHNNGEPMRWNEADFAFPIAGGYFVGPTPDGVGSHDPDPAPTTATSALRAADGPGAGHRRFLRSGCSSFTTFSNGTPTPSCCHTPAARRNSIRC